MEESTETSTEAPKQDRRDEVIQIFAVISQMLDVEVKVSAGEEGQKVEPAFDVNSIVSKFAALLVFSGHTVPPGAFLPPYNRVHADVEYWKKKFEGR